MPDKRDQFSISERYTSEHPNGLWVITQAVWRKFDTGDGGYWSHENYTNDPDGAKEVWTRPRCADDDKCEDYPPDVKAEYERLIEFDPDFDPGSSANLVEMIQGEEDDCAFDQPCMFGHRVDGHAVYCHNWKWLYSPRKCRRTWYTGGECRDEDCPGYAPNPRFAAKN